MTTLKFFQAEWCGPCKQQKPIVEDLENEYGKLTVERYDIEEDVEETNSYQVKSVPSIVIEHDGDVKKRFTGMTQRPDLEQAIEDTT